MKGSISLLMIVVALFAAPVALAQESGAGSFEHNPLDNLIVPDVEGQERVALARDLREAGLGELEAGNWDTAARQLEVSYLLVPTPEVLLPLSRALRELGFHRAALERLQRFFEGSTDTAARAQAQRELQSLRQHFGQVTLSTDPAGARVFLDGRDLGTTPLDEPLLLDSGGHHARAELEGYQPATRQVTVGAGESLDLLLTLEPAREPSDNRGLTAALWSMVGLTAAGAVALVVTAVLGTGGADELEAQLDPTGADAAAVERLMNASFWMAGTTAATGAAAIVLAVLRARADRDAQP